MLKTVVTTLDDISGKEGKVETITFAFEGEAFEIDLNPLNAANFRRSVAKYVKSARKLPKKAHTGRIEANRHHDREKLAAVRQWAQENGYNVGERGRIAQNVWDAYKGANA